VIPRVTVLLAAFNGGAYLLEAVRSVLAQTYEDFELLIVDDASTDGAVEALPRDSRIRVVRNAQNMGQIPSLNRGLREARGTYVARLDHDDVCLPDRLELQVGVLDEHPEIVLTATWADVIDADDRLWTRVRPRIDSFSDFAVQVVTGRVFLVHPTLMFRRESILDLQGFDEGLNASEDQDLYRRLVLAREQAYVVPKTLLRYRRHDQQMTIAKSAAVWESDERSYDRFLTRLAPGTPATTLRMMFRADPRFWKETPLADDALEELLAKAAEHLLFDDDERAKLARSLARSATVTMLSGWAGDARPSAYAAHARALAEFAQHHGDARIRRVASAAPALARTPALGGQLGGARKALARTLRSDVLAAPRRLARSSRMLRRLYARVIDTRAHD
jgi:GT2 family glycosyltransferase